MYRISLVNMPFSQLSLPSLALAQLKTAVEEKLGERARVRIVYLSHDFAKLIGLDITSYLNDQSYISGLGDWFFRSVAFPDQEDNTRQYFQRYFPGRDEKLAAMKGRLLAKRNGLERFMERLVDQYSLAEEDLVGLTSMFSQTVASFAMARLIKRRNPGIVTAIGGANCEGSMAREIVRNYEPMDLAFSGPALISFPELVEGLIEGRPDAGERLAGVYTRRNLASPHLEAKGAIGQDLPMNQVVRLDYDSFIADLERNFPGAQVRPMLSFETSRGCWWGERSHCTFCGLNGGSMAFREMTPPDAVAYLQDLIDRYGERVKDYNCVDNIMPRSYLKERVFSQLRRPEGVSFFYEVKADLKEHEMAALAEGGVTRIQPGIEALDTSTLKLMKKGTSSFHNLAFLKHCVTYGVTPAWNLLIGFPGEGAEVYEGYLRNLPLLRHLPPPTGAFPVRFDRFSPYHYRAKEYGLDLTPYDFYHYVYPFDEESLTNLAYYFEDRNYESKYLVDMLAWQQRLNEAVRAWQTRWLAKDGGAKPSLLFKRHGDSFFVLDSRDGQTRPHQLEAIDLEILDLMRLNGRKPSVVATELGCEEGVVTPRIERLQGLGLVFEEDGRFISLIVDGDRPVTQREEGADFAPPPQQAAKMRVVA